MNINFEFPGGGGGWYGGAGGGGGSRIIGHGAKRRPLRIQIKHSRRPWRGKLRKQWWSRIVATNGRVLYHSEGYLNEQDCIDAAREVATSEVVLELPR